MSNFRVIILFYCEYNILFYFNHNETQFVWATKLQCMLISVMLKTQASWTKAWLININFSFELINIWLVVIAMCNCAIG